MNVTFSKQDGRWIADVIIEGDFNLHVEKGAGIFAVSQSGVSGGKYDIVENMRVAHNDEVWDVDVAALVYPKYLRLEAYTESAPTVIVTYNA